MRGREKPIVSMSSQGSVYLYPGQHLKIAPSSRFAKASRIKGRTYEEIFAAGVTLILLRPILFLIALMKGRWVLMMMVSAMIRLTTSREHRMSDGGVHGMQFGSRGWRTPDRKR